MAQLVKDQERERAMKLPAFASGPAGELVEVDAECLRQTRWKDPYRGLVGDLSTDDAACRLVSRLAAVEGQERDPDLRSLDALSWGRQLGGDIDAGRC
jgi:hypothetical protein